MTRDHVSGWGSMAEPFDTGPRGSDWTSFEIEASVAAYGEMLLMLRNGQSSMGPWIETAKLELSVFLGLPRLGRLDRSADLP